MTEPALCDVAPVAAVMVVDAAYVFMAPTVLTSVKSPLFTELPESAASERLMWYREGYFDMSRVPFMMERLYVPVEGTVCAVKWPRKIATYCH